MTTPTTTTDRGRSIANGVDPVGSRPSVRFRMGLHLNYYEIAQDGRPSNRLGRVTPTEDGFRVELAEWIAQHLAGSSFLVADRATAERALATFSGIDCVVDRETFRTEVALRVSELVERVEIVVE